MVYPNMPECLLIVFAKILQEGVRHKMTGENVNLTHRQKKAALALLDHRTKSEAAAAAGVSPRTLYRWLGEPVFKAALAKAEGEAIGEATRDLVMLSKAAIGILEQVMNDQGNPPSVRLRAANSVMGHLVRLRELRNVEERLSNLEVAVYGKHQ